MAAAPCHVACIVMAALRQADASLLRLCKMHFPECYAKPLCASLLRYQVCHGFRLGLRVGSVPKCISCSLVDAFPVSVDSSEKRIVSKLQS